MRFIRWDYDHMLVTAWERTGACNQCGDCCRAGVGWTLFAYQQKEGFEKGWNLKDKQEGRNGEIACYPTGVWNEVIGDDGDKRYFFNVHIGSVCLEHQCPLLTLDNRCAEHQNKHQLSRDWPFDPRQVDGELWRCSFRFKKIGEWPMAECENREWAREVLGLPRLEMDATATDSLA